jgi:hypothetical protein
MLILLRTPRSSFRWYLVGRRIARARAAARGEDFGTIILNAFQHVEPW